MVISVGTPMIELFFLPNLLNRFPPQPIIFPSLSKPKQWNSAMDISFMFFPFSWKYFICLKVFCVNSLLTLSLSFANKPNILLPQRYRLPSSLMRMVFLPPDLTAIIFLVGSEVTGAGILTSVDVPIPNSPYLFFPQLYKKISFSGIFSLFCFIF